MTQFLQQIRKNFNITQKNDSLSLTLINPNINLPLFELIRQKFKLLNHLRRQQITIIEADTFTDELLSVLAHSLPLSLNELSLDFTGCGNLGGAGFVDLFERVSLMDGLGRLKLDFSQVYGINDFVIEGLGMLMENLTQLTDFYLDLYQIDQVTQDGYLILAQSLSHLHNTKKFHLDLSAYLSPQLSNPSLSEDALQLIFSSLPTGLTYFGFRILEQGYRIMFSIEQIGGGSLFRLAERIAEMGELEELCLVVSTFTELNLKAVESVLGAIGMLKKLKILNLNISNINLPQKSLSHLQLHPQLQSLTLDLSCNPRLTDQDTLNLMQKLSHTPNLRSITLNFDFCKFVSEQSIQCIVEQLVAGCRGLRKIVLADRIYTVEFVDGCLGVIGGNGCQLVCFGVNGNLELKGRPEFQRFLQYKQRQALRRNIIFGSYLVKNNQHLKGFQKHILKLFVK